MLASSTHSSTRSSRRAKTSAAAGAAWRCDDCQVWWGSQQGRKLKTSFLTRVHQDMAATLPWDEYRGWRLRGDSSVCPECSRQTGKQVYVIS